MDVKPVARRRPVDAHADPGKRSASKTLSSMLRRVPAMARRRLALETGGGTQVLPVHGKGRPGRFVVGPAASSGRRSPSQHGRRRRGRPRRARGPPADFGDDQEAAGSTCHTGRPGVGQAAVAAAGDSPRRRRGGAAGNGGKVQAASPIASPRPPGGRFSGNLSAVATPAAIAISRADYCSHLTAPGRKNAAWTAFRRRLATRISLAQGLRRTKLAHAHWIAGRRRWENSQQRGEDETARLRCHALRRQTRRQRQPDRFLTRFTPA